MPPRAVLAIAFTNKAADELKARVEALVGEQPRLRVLTFHSLCASLLRQHIKELDPGLEDFTIFPGPEARRCLGRALSGGITHTEEFGGDGGDGSDGERGSITTRFVFEARDARALQEALSRMKNHVASTWTCVLCAWCCCLCAWCCVCMCCFVCALKRDGV